jgi:carboxyl-terminal processing protease
MLPASNRGPGQALGFPDTCLTPAAPSPVPVPYPNIAMNAQATPFSVCVKVNMMNALNLVSAIPMTSGDEAGSAHPMFKQAQRYTLGSFNVFIDGMPGIHLGSMTTHNNMNCPVGAVVVPSAPNVTYSRLDPTVDPVALDPRASRALDAGEITELGRAMAGPGLGRVERDGATLVVELVTIGASVAQELEALLLRERPSALVLDLASCPGGSLEAAAEVASLFLPPGAVIAEITELDGDERKLFARGGGYPDLPLTVRVSRATASAAEVVAGALWVHARATLEGEATYGKGVTHELVVGADGASTLLRTGEVHLPGYGAIDGVGVGTERP